MKIKLVLLLVLLSVLNLPAMEKSSVSRVLDPEGFYFDGLVNGLSDHHRISRLTLAREAHLEFQKNFPYCKWVYDSYAKDDDFSVVAIANPKSEDKNRVWLQMLPVTDEGQWPKIKVACLRLDNLFKAQPEAYIMLAYTIEENGKKLFQSRIAPARDSYFANSSVVSSHESNEHKDKKIMALLKFFLEEKEPTVGQIKLDTQILPVIQNELGPKVTLDM